MSKNTSNKSSVFQYFNLSEDNKFYICNCIVNEDGNDFEEDSRKICESKISAFAGVGKNA